MELTRNAERRVLSLVPNNSELRTFNSELGEATDSELQTMPQDMASNPYPPQWAIAKNDVQV